MSKSLQLDSLGQVAPDFHLPDVNGDVKKLQDFHGCDALLVMFVCNHCPFVIHILQGIVDLVCDYQAKGLKAVAISSNDIESHPEDSPENMKKLSAQYGFPFPYLFDESQEVAKKYDAMCTPEFLLFDKDFCLYYRGQFDGSRPYTKWDVKFGKERNTTPVTGEDLRKALDDLLVGKEPPQPQIQSAGCSIKWKDDNQQS